MRSRDQLPIPVTYCLLRLTAIPRPDSSTEALPAGTNLLHVDSIQNGLDLSVEGKPHDLSPIEAQCQSPREHLATSRQREQRLRSCNSGSEDGSDGGQRLSQQASTSPDTRSRFF